MDIDGVSCRAAPSRAEPPIPALTPLAEAEAKVARAVGIL